MYLDWPFAIFNTIVGIAGFGFGYVGYLITQRISSTPLQVILSGPFLLISIVLMGFALFNEMWHLFGPLVKFVFGFL